MIWTALLRGARSLPPELIAQHRKRVLLLDPRSIISSLQLHIAAATSIHRQAAGLLRTTTLATDLLGCLCLSRKESIQKQMTYSQEHSTDLLIVAPEETDETAFQQLLQGISGERWVPLSELDDDITMPANGVLMDHPKVQWLLQLNKLKGADVLGGGVKGLEHAIVTLMAAKDHM
ncbi:hypothetical protein JKP88DRAFT_221257 [Tribonema minus]|uniref:Uncharacterized protein n=1 Tax=Tribonema minus TaxID=303371 RepID=A0A835YV19_9STRA|nr:hypothetical protein JKP88DRAFT_221257 [Tribonema minus]